MCDLNMHVTCMGCACNVHTVRMDVHVTCMGCACNVHTVYMEYACYMHGISNNPCMLHAWLPRHRLPCMQHAWSCDVHELCMFHACQTPEKRPNFLRVHACSYPLPGIWKETSMYIPCMEFHTCNCLLHTGNMHVSGAPFWVGLPYLLQSLRPYETPLCLCRRIRCRLAEWCGRS